MEKKDSIGKIVLISSIKALVFSLLVFVFVGVGLFVINPLATAKICNALGWKHAEVSCYELVYARSKNTDDLYNIIVKHGAIRNYAKQKEYINKFQNLDNYNDFCSNMDDSVVENYKNGKISAKTLSIIYGTDEYLTSSMIVDFMALRQYEDAYSVVEHLVSSNSEQGTYSLSIYNFVDFLMTNSVAKNVGEDYATRLFDLNVVDYLNARTTMLGTENYDEILQSHLQVKLAYTKYVLYYFVEGGESVNTTYNYNVWQTAVENYNAKIAE